MRDSTGYTGEAIVDTQNSLVQYFREKGLVNVAITEKKGYEFGMAQPAVLVIKSDGTVLEKWAIVPSAVCCRWALRRMRVLILDDRQIWVVSRIGPS